MSMLWKAGFRSLWVSTGHLQPSCFSRVRTSFVMESFVGTDGVLFSTFSCLRIIGRAWELMWGLKSWMQCWYLWLSHGHWNEHPELTRTMAACSSHTLPSPSTLALHQNEVFIFKNSKYFKSVTFTEGQWLLGLPYSTSSQPDDNTQ